MRPLCPVSGKAKQFDRCVATVNFSGEETRFTCDCREFGRADGLCFHRALHDDGLFALIRSRACPAPPAGVHLLEEYQARCCYAIVGASGSVILVHLLLDRACAQKIHVAIKEIVSEYHELPPENTGDHSHGADGVFGGGGGGGEASVDGSTTSTVVKTTATMPSMVTSVPR